MTRIDSVTRFRSPMSARQRPSLTDLLARQLHDNCTRENRWNYATSGPLNGTSHDTDARPAGE